MSTRSPAILRRRARTWRGRGARTSTSARRGSAVPGTGGERIPVELRLRVIVYRPRVGVLDHQALRFARIFPICIPPWTEVPDHSPFLARNQYREPMLLGKGRLTGVCLATPRRARSPEEADILGGRASEVTNHQTDEPRLGSIGLERSQHVRPSKFPSKLPRIVQLVCGDDDGEQQDQRNEDFSQGRPVFGPPR